MVGDEMWSRDEMAFREEEAKKTRWEKIGWILRNARSEATRIERWYLMTVLPP